VGVYVSLTEDACGDLEKFRVSGQYKHFLAKLVRLEEEGVAVGLPLGRELTKFRKIVVGNRDWRIIFQSNREETEVVVWVIGERGDDECYETAVRRLEALGNANPTVKSLASILYQLSQRRKGGG
jgi:mRNA interferase RelE/StbE